MKNSDYQKCEKCNGTGMVISPQAIGRELRERRNASGLTLRRAAELMGISAAFLSDCELGRRKLSAENHRIFLAVVGRKDDYPDQKYKNAVEIP